MNGIRKKYQDDIVANLKTALPILEAAPEERFALADYISVTDCGTLACAAGWLAIDLAPELAKKCRTSEGYPSDEASRLWSLANAIGACNEAFGPRAFAYLFAPHGSGLNDSYLFSLPTTNAGTDKELAIARFKLRIQQLEPV